MAKFRGENDRILEVESDLTQYFPAFLGNRKCTKV